MLDLPAFRFEASGAALPPERERPDWIDAATPPDPDLIRIVDAFADRLDAVGIAVVWQAEGDSPRWLAATADCRPASDTGRIIGEAIVRAASDRENGLHSDWVATQHGDRELLTIGFPMRGGTIFVVGTFGSRSPAVRTHVTREGVRLMPFLRSFFESWAKAAAAATRSLAMTAALDAAGVCVILLDREGHLIFANTAAHRLLGRADGLRRKGAALVGRSLADTMKLTAAIDQAVRAGGPASEAGRSTVPLTRADAGALLATVVGAGSVAAFGRSAAALLYVVDPDEDGRAVLEPVCRLYGLSRMEMRLASELAMGESLAEAARNLRVQPQTARSYLKHIFLKTDTRRQAELVRLLVTGAASVASVLPATRA